MKTRTGDPLDLRSFAYGCMAGIAIFIGVLFVISRTNDIRWQPVKITADDRYGCTRRQSDPATGECR